MPTTVTSILANPKRDTNDDLKVNDGDVVDGAAARGIQLVRLSTSNAALVLDGSASTSAASAPTDMVVLKTKAKDTAAATNWGPSTAATVSYLGAIKDTSAEKAKYSVIERSGSGATATYKNYVFVEDSVGATSASMIGTVGQTISLAKLLELERQSGVDFNGDNAIGDAVSAILASPKFDSSGDFKIDDNDLGDGGVAQVGKQLVKLASGAVALDYNGASTGSPALDVLVLKSKANATATVSTNWAPSTAAGVTYLGAIDQSEFTENGEVYKQMVIERTGSGATATYKGYVFVEDVDSNMEPMGTATMIGTVAQTLSLTQVLRLETRESVDLNGDKTIGDAVASVIGGAFMDMDFDGNITDADVMEVWSPDGSTGSAPAKGMQLVKLSSGATALDWTGAASSGSTATDMLVLRTKAAATAAATNWVPSTLSTVSYLGVVDQSEFTENGDVYKKMVIERTGSGATATYKGYVFVEDVDSNLESTGTATMIGTVGQTLSLTQVLQLESRQSLDLNGDKKIGDSVASVIGGPRMDTDYDGKITDEDTTEVLASDGSSTIVQAKGTQLVKLASGATALDWSGTATAGSSAGDLLVLRTKAAATAAATNWLPSTLSTVSYLGAVEQVETKDSGDIYKQMVIERTGSGATATYKGYAFVMDFNGGMEPTGTATMIGTVGQTLSLARVLELEQQGGIDLNGDTAIGDAVASVLGGARLDWNFDGKITDEDAFEVETPEGFASVLATGSQLVKLASGVTALDWSGTATTGSSAMEMPVLKTKASATATVSTNWAPSTLATVRYLGAIDQSEETDTGFVGKAFVIERTGSGATATYKGYQFVQDLDVDGMPTNSASMVGTVGQTLSLARVLQLEQEGGIDFNGDTAIGDAVASVLGGARLDWNFDGKITDDDVFDSDDGSGSMPAKGVQLVKLVSGATALDWSGTATTGSSAMDMPVLKVRATATAAATNWAPSTLATVTYLGAVDQSTLTDMAFTEKKMVVERTGSGATATYKGYTFVVDVGDDGMPTGTATMTGTAPQTLSLSQVLALESWGGVDFNGDKTIGDSVLSVLGGSKMDFNRDGLVDGGDVFTIDTPEGPVEFPAKGIQLVKLASGAAALDMSGAATVGSSASDMPVLQVKATATAAATNWGPTTVATVSFAGAIASEDGQTLSVIERAGTAATSAAKLWQFTVDYRDSGEAAGTATMIGTVAQTLSANQLLSLESQSGVDLNGDGTITLAKMVEGTEEATKIEGDVGNDMLFGGAGVDTMVGGLGADLFMFTDVDESSFVPSKATDVINDLSVVDDMLVFNLNGPLGMRIKGNYGSAASFAKAADKLLNGKVKAVFGTVGNDGYLAVDDDGDGVTHLIQLVGVKQAPSILTSDSLPDGFGL